VTVEYSQDELCDHIASGKSLVSWCNKSGIGYSTIMAHLAKDLAFQEKYARAREHQADYLVDEILAISDDVSQDVTVDAKGNHVVDGFGAQRARLMVDSRKWVASKMRPKKYGDTLKHTGDPDEPVIQKHSLEVSFVGNTNRDTGSV
jgi:hypothetical protein